MPRLIDAEKLWKAITTRIEEYCDIADLIEIIETQPTVDAEPVRHGHWLAVKGWDDVIGELDNAECSVCHETQEGEYWAKTYYKYCPNCGAKMDEVEE